jgi:hypothetical protein
MKKTFSQTIGGMALSILMLVMFAPVSVSAQDNEQKNDEQTKENSSRAGGRLEGVWDVQVTIRNCQTGAAIRTFASITTFAQGGTVLDTTSGIPQALRTPGQGVWSHVSGETYRFRFKAFNFDTSGNSTGWTIINHVAHLNRSADEFESAGASEVYDPNGTLIFTGCSSTTAVRFE